MFPSSLYLWKAPPPRKGKYVYIILWKSASYKRYLSSQLLSLSSMHIILVTKVIWGHLLYLFPRVGEAAATEVTLSTTSLISYYIPVLLITTIKASTNERQGAGLSRSINALHYFWNYVKRDINNQRLWSDANWGHLYSSLGGSCAGISLSLQVLEQGTKWMLTWRIQDKEKSAWK